MIRKVLLSSVAFIAISGTAFAADLPSRRAPPVYVPPPIPVFSWTGFYVGGQLGYEFGGRDSATQIGVAVPVSYNVGRPDGLGGGVHVGYNFSTQSLPVFGAGFGGIFGAGGVIGVEGDANASDYRSNITFPGAVPLFNKGYDTVDGSVRGRLGIAVDRALFYVTGGAAFADLHENYVIGGVIAQSFDHTRVGYTVGGGAEYALTPQFSLRAEYRYTDYGTFTDFNSATGGVPFNTTHRETNMRVQVGFSYKFDTPLAPVVARY